MYLLNPFKIIFLLLKKDSKILDMSNKIVTTVYLTEEQDKALKKLKDETKVPIAEYIREGIDLILEKHGRLIPGQLSFEDVLKKKK